jgi:hypothetical protein
MNLTTNFTLAEMVASQEAVRRGFDNTPGPDALAELKRTAELLEKVRAILNVPIIVTSGYRCLDVNRAIGSADTSAHVQGMAVDFIAPAFGRPIDICRRLQAHAQTLDYDQLIHEFASWTHLGRRTGNPRQQDLTINANGTFAGIV